MFVTFFDTCMVSLAAIFVWRINPYYVFVPWLTIACLDGSYLSSALTKVPDGAWFTLTLAAVLASAFILWRFGKEQQWAAEAEDRFPTSHFVIQREDGSIQLQKRYGGGVLSSIRGFGIFFDKAGETTPIVFSQFISKLVAAPEVMVFFHLRPLETPSVAPEDRYSVSRLAIPNCYRVVLRHGYLDTVITPDLASILYEHIRGSIVARDFDPFSERHNIAPGSASIDERKVRRSTSMASASRLPAIHHDETQINSSPDTAVGDTPTTSTAPTNPTISFKIPNRSQPGGTTSPMQDTNTEDPSSNGTLTKEPKSEVTTSKGKDRTHDSILTGELLTTTLELQKLESAYAHQVLYIIGKEQMKIKPNPHLDDDTVNSTERSFGGKPWTSRFWNGIWGEVRQGYWIRRLLLSIFLWVRENTRTKIANLRVPMDRVFEVGFIKEL